MIHCRRCAYPSTFARAIVAPYTLPIVDHRLDLVVLKGVAIAVPVAILGVQVPAIGDEIVLLPLFAGLADTLELMSVVDGYCDRVDAIRLVPYKLISICFSWYYRQGLLTTSGIPTDPRVSAVAGSTMPLTRKTHSDLDAVVCAIPSLEPVDTALEVAFDESIVCWGCNGQRCC